MYFQIFHFFKQRIFDFKVVGVCAHHHFRNISNGNIAYTPIRLMQVTNVFIKLVCTNFGEFPSRKKVQSSKSFQNLQTNLLTEVSVTRQRKLITKTQAKWVLIHCGMSVGAQNWYRASLFGNVGHIKFSF